MISFKAPYLAELLDENGLLGRVWAQYWRLIDAALDYLGEEEFVDLNSDGSEHLLTKLDYKQETYVDIDVLFQKTTASSEYVLQKYTFGAGFEASSKTWVASISTSGIFIGSSGSGSFTFIFTLYPNGEVKYTYTDPFVGTPILNRIIFRKRRIAAKSSLYSQTR